MPFAKTINILVLSPLQRIYYSQLSVGCPQATRSVIISILPTLDSPLRSIVSIGGAKTFCHQGGARFASEVTSKKYQQCVSPDS
jgi:glutathionyl-hydroquinone reductase